MEALLERIECLHQVFSLIKRCIFDHNHHNIFTLHQNQDSFDYSIT